MNKLLTWPNYISKVKNFDEKSMFPSLGEYFSQSLQQLVIMNKSLYGDDEHKIIEESKRSLIRVATFQGILRCLESKAVDKEIWYNEYTKD
jgi:hypothetical protein